ncbi:MAG: hypothetical protein OSJ39_00435 [Clostridia bacterium]|nr:hypothetical protein [Clostridia bacterium]
MESPDKKLQELLNYPERECPDPGLADDAAWITYEFYGRKKRRGKKIWPKLVSVCAACAAAIVLAIVLPIYCRPAPPPAADEPHRYLEDELVRENIDNVDIFLTEHHESVKCFYVAGAQSYVYRVIETAQSVILQQSFMNVANGRVDIINFEVCLTNDEFSRHDTYVNLIQYIEYEGIAVKYKVESVNNRNTTFANFEYENHEYYMSISSTKGQADLEYYMQLLLGENET